MWFSSARKARRTPAASARRGAFRPRLEALEDRCLLSAGALDPTFGSGGLVTGPSSQATYTALPASPVGAVVVLPAGNIVTGGYLTVNGVSEFALVCYYPNGTPDTSFGTNGVVETPVGVGNSYINGLAYDARIGNGDIVAVGQAVNVGNNSAFAVACYNSTTGALDTTNFGSGTGIVLTNAESDQGSSKTVGAFAVAIDRSGNIDVAGTANFSLTVNTGDEFALARYTANGTPDPTFDGGSMVVTPQFVASQADQALALAIDQSDNIVVAGTTGNPVGANTTSWTMAVVRYTPTGGLDTSFDGTGIVTGLVPPAPKHYTYSSRAHGVLIQSNGDIVVAGNSFLENSSNEYQALARLTSSGQIDTSFGGAGTGYAINTNLYGALALAQSANGDLLAASATPLNVSPPANELGVAAFLPSGLPDTTFGNNGTATADFSGGVSYGSALAIQPDGKIVVAGFITPTSSTFTIALARFLPPEIGSFSASSAGGSVTLSASNIMNSNPTSTISYVYFYLQTNSGLTLLGSGTDSNGTWTFTFSETTYGLKKHNTYTFVAQAVDSNGDLSDPVTVTLTVL